VNRKDNADKCGASRELSLEDATRQLTGQVPAAIQNAKVEVSAMSDDEVSLEARLDRALTPEMKQRLREALAHR
jgi:hypothetical protein